MRTDIRVAPQNSLLLIMDPSVGEVPLTMAGTLIAATPTAVAVGTLSEHDGETSITLSDELPAFAQEQPPKFEGLVATPRKKIVVATILGQELLSLETPTTQTRLRVWSNHDTEPDDIFILAGE